jgi:hypothetical protein
MSGLRCRYAVCVPGAPRTCRLRAEAYAGSETHTLADHAHRLREARRRVSHQRSSWPTCHGETLVSASEPALRSGMSAGPLAKNGPPLNRRQGGAAAERPAFVSRCRTTPDFAWPVTIVHQVTLRQ